ncbi:MAG: hypothetical protein ABSA81_03645 [Candidatus Bathyarchaeia archaeon]|jgi:cytoskeletal protein CcmA (bactofilin family)
MNLTYLLYSYIAAVAASLGLIIVARQGIHDSERRTFPEVTLNYWPGKLGPQGRPESRRTSDKHRLGNAMVFEGDYVLPSKAELSSDLVIKGALTLGSEARLHGSAKASRSINLGPHALVVGHLVTEANIFVGVGAEVVGFVHAKDDVWLMPKSNVVMSVVSAGTVYLCEDAKVGRQIYASRGIVHKTSQNIPQSAPQQPANYVANSRESLQPVCYRCRSILLELDILRHQWRCLNCGSYQWPANGISQHSWNPNTT